jgi:hypothetical protein
MIADCASRCAHCQSPIVAEQRWVPEKIYESALDGRAANYVRYHSEPFSGQEESCWEFGGHPTGGISDVRQRHGNHQVPNIQRESIWSGHSFCGTASKLSKRDGKWFIDKATFLEK